MALNTPKLIGLAGYSRSGKDTVGEYLESNYDFLLNSFAYQVKMAAAALFGLEEYPEAFFDTELKNTSHPSLYDLTPTQVAQYVGTEMVREGLAKLIGEEKAARHWITILESQMLDPYMGDVVDVITDVRFLNEYQWIKEKQGVIIQVVRPGYSGGIGLKEHRSDTELGDMLTDETQPDFIIINDGTKEELYERVDVIMQQLGFKKYTQ